MKYLHRFLCLTLTAMLLFIQVVPGCAEAILSVGQEGDEVTALQVRLIELGYLTKEADGIFDQATEQALISFQRTNDLLVTGMADATTQSVLFSDHAIPYASPSLFDLYDMVEECEIGYLFSGTANRSYAMYSSCMSAPFDTREYTFFREYYFQSVSTAPLSTFAADVDTASWAQIRQMLLRGEHVPTDSVRIEEMLNYFRYDYHLPENKDPFGVTMELGDCPWNEQAKLLLVGLQAEKIQSSSVPQNLVFLIDVSGSMDEPDKLPLVKRAFLLLLDSLAPEDTISIVTYASHDEVILDGVSAADKVTVMDAINALEAGGGTNGSAGIITAYELAEKHQIPGGVNRILLATDGDLNIGVTDEGDLARLVMEKKQSGTCLTVLGFGGDNYKDNRMEALADYGSGNYHYIDTIHEARRALITEAGGTFRTIAWDVKLQLDFNPAKVKGYRLIGYEDRLLQAEDFADDTKDGGEIGSGHQVTALYELIPADSTFDFGITESRYTAAVSNNSTDWLTLSIRAKTNIDQPSNLYTYPLQDEKDALPGENLAFASAVAELGMLLRNSEWKGNASYDQALNILRSCSSISGDVYKEELLYLAGLMQRNAMD